MLSFGGHAVSTRDLAYLDAAIRIGVVGPEFFDESTHERLVTLALFALCTFWIEEFAFGWFVGFGSGILFCFFRGTFVFLERRGSVGRVFALNSQRLGCPRTLGFGRAL